MMVTKDHPKLSISKKCDLLSIHRSGTYYTAQQTSELNLELMRMMDEHYLKHPYKGAKRMHTWLKMDMWLDGQYPIVWMLNGARKH